MPTGKSWIMTSKQWLATGIWAIGLAMLAVAATVAFDTPAGSPELINRLRNLTASEKQELERKRDRFYRLPEQEQQRLRALHAQLEASPDGPRLRQVMERYANWLRELPAGQRAELLSLPRDSRRDQIQRLLQQQEAGRMRHYVAGAMSDDDLKVIVGWMEDYLVEREDQLLERLPELRQRWDSLEPRHRRQILVHAAVRSRSVREMLRPGEEDIQRIKDQLSSEAQSELRSAQQEDRLAELAESWMRAAMFSRRSAPEVPQEELRRFYAEMDGRWREYFESLPADRMESELKRWYHFRHFFDSDRTPRGRPGELPRGWGSRGRPGDTRPGGPGEPRGERPGGVPEWPPGPFGPGPREGREGPATQEPGPPREGRPGPRERAREAGPPAGEPAGPVGPRHPDRGRGTTPALPE